MAHIKGMLTIYKRGSFSKISDQDFFSFATKTKKKSFHQTPIAILAALRLVRMTLKGIQGRVRWALGSTPTFNVCHS